MTGAGKGAPTAAGGGCSQATTFLNRTSGLSNAESTAYTNLICGMVTDGTYSLMDGLYIFATNTTATAALNLVSTSFSLTVHGTCTFAADSGYTGDATTCWMDTGFQPSTAGGNMTLNSGHIGVCQLSTTLNGNNWIGGNDGAAQTEFQDNGSGIFYDVNDGNFPSFAYTNKNGGFIASRTASNLITMYQNGASVGTNATASGRLVQTNLIFFAQNNSGTQASLIRHKPPISIVGYIHL
jgi:hypothetical protein